MEAIMSSCTVYYRKNFTPSFTVPESVDLNDYRRITSLPTTDLETVFREMNVVDGTEMPVRLKVRSLSVGDVVVTDDGQAWYCAAVGWEKVTVTGG
jgi:hypothetical protein